MLARAVYRELAASPDLLAFVGMNVDDGSIKVAMDGVRRGTDP